MWISTCFNSSCGGFKESTSTLTVKYSVHLCIRLSHPLVSELASWACDTASHNPTSRDHPSFMGTFLRRMFCCDQKGGTGLDGGRTCLLHGDLMFVFQGWGHGDTLNWAKRFELIQASEELNSELPLHLQPTSPLIRSQYAKASKYCIYIYMYFSMLRTHTYSIIKESVEVSSEQWQ